MLKNRHFMSKKRIRTKYRYISEKYVNIVKGLKTLFLYLRAELVDNNYETIIGSVEKKSYSESL